MMAGGQIPMVPYFPRKTSREYQWMDIYNAHGRQRTLFVGRFLDDEACNQLIASLIFLQGYYFYLYYTGLIFYLLSYANMFMLIMQGER